MSESTTTLSKRPRGRSPAYPAIDLEKAVQRVRQVWSKDKQFEVPVSNLPAVWEYASLNGPASLTLSALRKFGLLDQVGSKDERVVTVTDLAVRILAHPSSDARVEALKEAALTPPIHLELWNQYGINLPSDANLAWKLSRERGFTDTGAKEFLREWRETINFARLGAEDAVATQVEEADGEERPFDTTEFAENLKELDGVEQMGNPERYIMPDRYARNIGAHQPAAQTLGKPVQSYPIPVALQGTPPVIVSGAFPLNVTEWNQFMAVLTAMKPVLMSDVSPAVSDVSLDTSFDGSEDR